MVTQVYLDEELEHPAWSGHRVPANPPGLALTQVKSVDSYIVKFSFNRKGVPGSQSGTGFLLNIAGITGASHNIVLTAAHNLIAPDGSLSTDMAAWIRGEERNIPQDDYRISSAFSAKQSDATDFGAVLLPRDDPLSTGGFGFDLTLGDMKDFKRKVFITGYRAGSDPGPGTATSESEGNCISYPDQLEYFAKTEQGISGSPVWIGFDGRPIVIAIHNHGAVGRGGSKGSRLTLTLLREALSWVNAYESAVRIRAYEPDAEESEKFPDPKGLYLHFSPTFAFGRVKLGNGTIFDIVPARALPFEFSPPEPGVGSTRKPGDWNSLHEYALVTNHPETGRHSWVGFNPARGEVVLVDTLNELCLFCMGGTPKQLNRERPGVRIVVQDYANEKKRVQLKMSNQRIREFDGEHAESSEVSFVGHPTKNKDTWTVFIFEKGDKN